MTTPEPPPPDLLITILDRFARTPLDHVTLPSNFDRSIVVSSSSVGAEEERSARVHEVTTALRTFRTVATKDKEHRKLDLLSDVSADQCTAHSWTNAVRDAVGNMDSKNSGILPVTGGAKYELVFPCLSLNGNLEPPNDKNKVNSFVGDVLGAGSLLEDNFYIQGLLKRPLATPLQNLLERKLSPEHCHHSFPCQSLHKLFTALIHRRLRYWLELLKRAVSLEDQDCDSNKKRVLAALLDVQSSIQVNDDLTVKFSTNGEEAVRNPTTDMDEVLKMEQELADTLNTMKGGSMLGRAGVSSMSSKEAKRDRSVESKDLFFPEIDDIRRQLKPTGPEESNNTITLPLLFEARASVTAQIGEELEHKQSVMFQTTGTVKGYFDVESRDCSLVRVELSLNTDELYASVEKQARSVARSTAESVLLNAATEEELDSNHSSSLPASGVKIEEDYDSNYGQDEVFPSAAFPADTKTPSSPKQMWANSPFGVHASFGPPITVSPITTPGARRTSLGEKTPSPPVSFAQIPLVSPPPSAVSSATTQKRRIFSSSVNIFDFPYSKRSKTDPFVPLLRGTKDLSGNVEDVAGALTALKHSN